MSETPQIKSKWCLQRRILIGVAMFATLVAVFYTEESWRGKRAWENCKRELDAKGAVLDWNAYIPPPVPDDENFFKAPKMTEWFVGRNITNDLTSRLNVGFRPKPCQVAEVIVLPVLTNTPTAENADMILRYDPFRAVRFSPATVAETNDSSNELHIPLIRFVDVPITLGISNLARQAGINVILDSKINYGQPDQNGRIKPEPTLSIQWVNISAKEALLAVLNNYGLQLIYDPETKVARITTKDADTSKKSATPEVRDQLMKLFASVIGTNSVSVYQNYAILARPPEDTKPMRIVLESDTTPNTNELRELFAESIPNRDADIKYDRPHISVEPDGDNAFQVMLNSASAADYLAWSDQFEPDFNLIREALKRPYARMEGDYSNPIDMPVPNFITVRVVAQALAQRAKCSLLLGRPEEALRELMLMHDICRLLEASPTGKPMTLVAAMINVAVTGLYADIISEGFRLQAWQGPQLAVLQAQLSEITLSPLLSQAFREEPAASCRSAEMLPFRKIVNWAQIDPEKWYEKIIDWFWPRGWTYQNMVYMAELDQNWQKGFDLASNMILPRKLDEAERNINKFVESVGRLSPYKYLASIAVPDFTRAFQATAHNQTVVNEAQIICALERYHLAHGEYPETLVVLVPQFIETIPHDIIGGQPLHYRRKDDGNFLLYSVGWNETDDGGLPGSAYDDTRGDWVWKN